MVVKCTAHKEYYFFFFFPHSSVEERHEVYRDDAVTHNM